MIPLWWGFYFVFKFINGSPLIILTCYLNLLSFVMKICYQFNKINFDWFLLLWYFLNGKNSAFTILFNLLKKLWYCTVTTVPYALLCVIISQTQNKCHQINRVIILNTIHQKLYITKIICLESLSWIFF